ncbi:MAG: 30S ribosomal protein S7 [Candidatus Shapirobacteria bacterium]|nr:30S ribosomal protein S7 [Candidatus Shapirobacteria bacterium]MDD5073701.1 30S ribosomal protein S7 [Candidatus Shapirobacteria bacterium]MDD5481778.1 30S ribosomal protein S7 [Candidatus Shapirobacteria bacterium]
MRGKKAKLRTIGADPKFDSLLVAKIINQVMISGKKTVAQKHVYQALEEAGKKTNKEPLAALEEAIGNIKPQMEVRPRRIGGAAYQIPVPVSSRRQTSLAIRWLVDAARTRPNKEYHTFAEKLTAEIVDAVANEGVAIKKREDTHKMAEANKAFSHFRW